MIIEDCVAHANASFYRGGIEAEDGGGGNIIKHQRATQPQIGGMERLLQGAVAKVKTRKLRCGKQDRCFDEAIPKFQANGNSATGQVEWFDDVSIPHTKTASLQKEYGFMVGKEPTKQRWTEWWTLPARKRAPGWASLWVMADPCRRVFISARVKNDLLLNRTKINIEALAGKIEERFAACLLGRNNGVLLGRVRSPGFNQQSYLLMQAINLEKV